MTPAKGAPGWTPALLRDRFEEFLDGLSDVVYVHDLTGRFLLVNDAATRLFGYTREEMLAMGIQAIVDPGHLATAQEHMRRKVEGRSARSAPYELLTRTKQGRPVWVEVSSSVVTVDGVPVAVQGVARNVNERKANEEAMRLVQRVAGAIQAGRPFPEVFAVACEGLGSATGCARIEGWVPDAQGRLHLQAAWPARRSVQEEKFHRLSERAGFGLESGIARRAAQDGCPRWVPDLQHEPEFLRSAAAHAAGYRGLLSVPLLGQDGRLVALLLMFTDGSDQASPPWLGLVESVASQLGTSVERRGAQDHVVRLAELLALQMELAPVAMLVVAPDGSVLGANHRFLEVCGLPPVQRLQPFDETFVARLPDPEAFLARAREAYESDRRGNDEMRLGGRLLKRHTVDLAGPGGRVVGRAVFLRDLTAQRQAEDELRALRA